MIIARPVWDDIRRRLEAAYPEEGCGLLLGAAGEVTRVQGEYPVPNRRRFDGAAALRYLIGPDEFRGAAGTAAARGLELVGVYHSHPDVTAWPSDYDREHAWPWYEYLIVSVAGGGARELRAWRLRDDRSGFDEQPVTIAG